MQSMQVWQKQCPCCFRKLERPADDYAWWCICGYTTEDVSRLMFRRMEGPDNVD